MQLDVSNKAQVAALWDKVPQELRSVDILGINLILKDKGLLLKPIYSAVNNAGFVLGLERVGSIADADIEAMFSTNVLGLISVSQLLVKGEIPTTSIC